MNAKVAATTSPALRRGYALGMLLKRGYWHIKALELRLAERVQVAGVHAGQQLVRGGFLIAGLSWVGATKRVATV